MIHSMNFNVVDSASARLCRGQHELDGIDLPYQLASQNSVEIPLAFAIEDKTALHNLRGVLTYMAQVLYCQSCEGLYNNLYKIGR